MKIMDRIDTFFTAIAMICLFAIAVIVAVDGLGRQFFNSPIVGAYVLVEQYLMTAMIFPVIAYTWAKNGHVSVTLFYDKMPQALQNIVYLITILIGLAIYGLIGYTGYETTLKSITGHQTTSGLIRWPLWAAYIWMPIGSMLFCIRLITEFFTSIIRICNVGLNNAQLRPGTSAHGGAD